MKELNTDLFDPRTTLMEPDFSRAVTPLADADGDNFAFALNYSNFSEQQLRIEIIGDTPKSRPDSEACTSIADWALHQKRWRENIKKENILDLAECPNEQIFNDNQPDMDDCEGCENPVGVLSESLACEAAIAWNMLKRSSQGVELVTQLGWR
ncbi:hypothetical protein ACFX2I_033772 [Malus domestica]